MVREEGMQSGWVTERVRGIAQHLTALLYGGFDHAKSFELHVYAC